MTDSLTETLETEHGTPTGDTVVTADTSPNDEQTVVAVVPEEVDEDLAQDTLFELLKNQRRRDAIEFLKANDGWTTLSDMAEHIAAKENDVPLEALNSKQRKRVYIGLYQCHLPKMAKAGVVDFDKNRGTIQIEPLAAKLDPYLAVDAESTTDTTAGTGLARSPESVLFGVVGAAALAGAVGLPGFDAVAAAGWAAASGLALLAAAALPALRRRHSPDAEPL